MPTNDHARVTWPEWGGIVAICTATGTVWGAASYWQWHTPRIPVAYLLPLGLGALVVSFAFAMVASVFAAILAAFGAVHPFVVVFALARWISAASIPHGITSLGPLVAASGFISGALIVPKYVPRVRARIVNS